MKFDMSTAKEKFNNFFGRIKIFFFENKKAMMIILPIVFFIIFLLIMLLILLANSSNEEGYRAKESPEIHINNSKITNGLKKLNPNSLWLLDEPLKLPPIQFSREQRKLWKKAEVDYWYEPPSEKAMEELRQKNKKIIDDLLEDAP